MKKQFYIIVDTETTEEDTVADFGAVVCDRHGVIFHEIGVLVAGEFGEKKLFHDQNSKLEIWNMRGLQRRTENYNSMLNSGSRVLASVNAINRWLDKAISLYNPELTAYNLAFDLGKCANTGIDLTRFDRRFCLWQASVGNICNTKKYKKFVLDNHYFNNRTEKGNMTIQTSAERVTHFVTGADLTEPHTALEDARDFELKILKHILKKRAWRENMRPYSWHDHQLNNHFSAN
jgi:hypothetical protein